MSTFTYPTPFTPLKLLVHFDRVRSILKGEIPDPVVVEIFPSRACPHTCPYCRCRPFRGIPPEFIDVDMLFNLFDQLRSRGVHALEFSGGGEPLSHPRIGTIVRKAYALGFEVGLITCGSSLNEGSIADAIIDCCRWCRVALDTATAETYGRIHGNSLSFADLCAGIEDLARRRHRRQKKMIVGIKYLVSRLNAHECYEGARLAAVLGVDYIQFAAVRNYSSLEIDDSQTGEIEHAIGRARSELQSSVFTVVGGVKRSLVERPCVLTPLHAVIDTDGEVYLCPFFEHRFQAHGIANIRDHDFFTIWGSENHRRAIERIDVDKCRVYDCPAVAYQPFMDTHIRGDPLCVQFP